MTGLPRHLGGTLAGEAVPDVRDGLSYKGFVGSVDFNADDEVFYGKIAGVADLVTSEGTTVAGLAASFREAVEDYLVLCRTIGKPARKSYSGVNDVTVDLAPQDG